MVQVIRANPRQKSPSTGEQLGTTFGKLAVGALGAYQQHQKKKEYEQGLTKAEEIFANPNLSPEEKQIGLFKALKENPDVAKAIGQQLAGVQKEQQKYKSKSAENAAKLAGEQKTQKELTSFADRLESQNPKYAGIADVYRLDIPLDQKTKIVQSITGTDIFKEDQQRRLHLDSTLKRYNSRLKELDQEIKDVSNPNSTGKEQANELRRQRMALRDERDQLLDFKALSGYEDEEAEEAEQEIPEEGSKVKFDPANAKHKAVAEKLFKKYKDKEKVRKILSKQFKGL